MFKIISLDKIMKVYKNKLFNLDIKEVTANS